MRQLSQRPFWTGPRVMATAGAALVLAIFIGANAHLVAVSLASHPDCVLQTPKEGVAAYNAAKPSC